MEINMFSAIAIPVGTAIVSVIAAFLVALFHFYDAKKMQTNERVRQDENKLKHLRIAAGNRIVSSVNSNDNAPRLREDLSGFFDNLGIDIRMDLRGCAENGVC